MSRGLAPFPSQWPPLGTLGNVLPILISHIIPYSSLESMYFSEIICGDVWLQSVLARKLCKGEMLACAVVYHDIASLLGDAYCRISNALRSQADGRHTKEDWV